jgi:hypothetical protein
VLAALLVDEPEVVVHVRFVAALPQHAAEERLRRVELAGLERLHAFAEGALERLRQVLAEGGRSEARQQRGHGEEPRGRHGQTPSAV